ncbi:MAG TPA: hypothetical protein VM260_06825 [Pirellula sp.]|nr:hypothetical protein [Pirellula sp.]
MNLKSNQSYLKIGMIPLFGGILYYVLSGNQSVPDITADNAKNGIANSPATGKLSEKPDGHDFVSKQEWPEFQLNGLENVDPFDKRMIFPESAPKFSDSSDSDKQTLVSTISRSGASRLENIKVQAVFQSPKGIAALVGEQVIHVGDLLQDGTQVIGITPEHLILASPTNAASIEVGS